MRFPKQKYIIRCKLQTALAACINEVMPFSMQRNRELTHLLHSAHWREQRCETNIATAARQYGLTTYKQLIIFAASACHCRRAIACTAGSAGNVREQFNDCMSSCALARTSYVYVVVLHLHSTRRLNKYFKCNYLVVAINSCRRKRWSFDGWRLCSRSSREMIFRNSKPCRNHVWRHQWFEFAANERVLDSVIVARLIYRNLSEIGMTVRRKNYELAIICRFQLCAECVHTHAKRMMSIWKMHTLQNCNRTQWMGRRLWTFNCNWFARRAWRHRQRPTRTNEQYRVNAEPNE